MNRIIRVLIGLLVLSSNLASAQPIHGTSTAYHSKSDWMTLDMQIHMVDVGLNNMLPMPAHTHGAACAGPWFADLNYQHLTIACYIQLFHTNGAVPNGFLGGPSVGGSQVESISIISSPSEQLGIENEFGTAILGGADSNGTIHKPWPQPSKFSLPMQGNPDGLEVLWFRAIVNLNAAIGLNLGERGWSAFNIFTSTLYTNQDYQIDTGWFPYYSKNNDNDVEAGPGHPQWGLNGAPAFAAAPQEGGYGTTVLLFNQMLPPVPISADHPWNIRAIGYSYSISPLGIGTTVAYSNTNLHADPPVQGTLVARTDTNVPTGETAAEFSIPGNLPDGLNGYFIQWIQNGGESPTYRVPQSVSANLSFPVTIVASGGMEQPENIPIQPPVNPPINLNLLVTGNTASCSVNGTISSVSLDGGHTFTFAAGTLPCN